MGYVEDLNNSADIILLEINTKYMKDNSALITSIWKDMNSKYERHLLWNLRGKKSQNYAVLGLKFTDMGRKVQESNACDEAEN